MPLVAVSPLRGASDDTANLAHRDAGGGAVHSIRNCHQCIGVLLCSAVVLIGNVISNLVLRLWFDVTFRAPWRFPGSVYLAAALVPLSKFIGYRCSYSVNIGEAVVAFTLQSPGLQLPSLPCNRSHYVVLVMRSKPNILRPVIGETDLARPFISTRALHGLDHGLRLQIGPASLRKLLDSVDLPAGALETPRAYVPQAHAIAFLGAVAGHVGYSNALFALGDYSSVKSYGLFGEFVTGAKTFGAAMAATRDLMAFHVSYDRLCLRHEGDDFRVYYHAALHNIRHYEHYAPLALVVVLSIAEPYFGRRYRRSVTLNIPKPRNTADFEDFFGCDVRFDQPELSVVFDRAAATATRRLQAARVITLGDVARDAFGAAPRTLVPAVEALVRANIEGATNIDGIARRLDMSERTLRRRLDHIGTNFRELVRRIRVDFARELLTQTDLDVTEIAQRVGYSHPSHLDRAFRELTGISPAALRYAARNKVAGNG